jgi:Ca-activated chloride channel family protein
MPSRPEFFRLFFIIIPVIAVMLWNYIVGKKSLRGFAGSWRPKKFYELYSIKSFFSFLGMIVFIVFSILSVAGFPGREIPVSYEPAGTDIVFAVDISQSMRAQDVLPSRLDAAARVISSVCDNTPEGRFGVVVFKGKAINMIPSTEDVESVYSFLEFLSTDLLTSPGSSLEAGIAESLAAFTTGEERRKYIFLISDGEALSGSLEQVLLDAVENDVVIYSIGVGTAEGANIPAADSGVLLDSSGSPVLSRLDEESLRYIAESTGGKYFSAGSHSMLTELIGLAAGTAESGESRYRIVAKENYRIFLVIALIGLFIYRAVKVVKWKNDF